MKYFQLFLFLVVLILGVGPNLLYAQIASYSFDNTLDDELNGHQATYLINGETNSETPIYQTDMNGTELALDPVQGIQFPTSLISAIDTVSSLEIDFTFTITDIGDGAGVMDLLNCQEQANEPGFTINLRHDLFSNEEDYEIIFSYADGGFNQGVPNHPGHDETRIGYHLEGEEVNLRLILDFENRVWSSIVNGNYTSREFEEYYNWGFMLESFKVNSWFFGWHGGQENDMIFNPDLYTSSVSVDQLAIYSPRQAGDTQAVLTALEAMTEHVNGSVPLSLEERNMHLNTVYLNYFNNHLALATEVFEYTNAYEANNEPVYAERQVVPITTLLPESQLLIFLQQAIFDNEYEASNLPNMEGIAFEFADVFPGPVDTSAPREAGAIVEVNATYAYIPAARVVSDLSPAKRPTGYYAAPGELITINLATEYIEAGLEVMIGAHDSDHSSRSETNRFNRISKTFALEQETTQIVNPFGGGIYIKVPEGSDLGWLEVTISGAVATPYFSWRSDRESDPVVWAAALTAHTSEWVDLESDKYMMTLPLSQVAGLSDPTSLMEQWDDIMQGFRYVGGRPIERPRTEYFLVDSRLPSDAFGTGYPQVIGDNLAPFGPLGATVLYPTQVLEPDFYDSSFDITFHEMGHAALHPTLPTEVETIVHLNAVYVYNELYGLPIDEAFVYSSGERHTLNEAAIDWMIADNFRNGRAMGCDPTMEDFVCDELRYQHRGYAKYIQMADIFGWEAVYEMNNVFYENWNTTPNMDNWMIVEADNVIAAASYGMNVNMAPLMHFWGLNPSEELIEELALLPRSQDLKQMLFDYRDLVPTTAVAFQPWYDINFPKKDPVHYDRYNAALNNYDSENYGIAMKTQIDFLIELYFPIEVNTAELSAAGITVSPNPTQGLVYVDLGEQAVRSLQVTDISGRVVYEQFNLNAPSVEFYLNEIPGVYLLQINTEKEIFTSKLVKIK